MVTTLISRKARSASAASPPQLLGGLYECADAGGAERGICGWKEPWRLMPVAFMKAEVRGREGRTGRCPGRRAHRPCWAMRNDEARAADRTSDVRGGSGASTRVRSGDDVHAPVSMRPSLGQVQPV